MYQALYRKYRPKVFADVVGQDHVTRTLMNEVRTGRHSHAYLFTGSRGTGKTTCAKIFAKAVNCEHPVNGDPCNECEVCRGIDSGAVLDVVEIDAASNNGVDSIRDIRDEANFTPVSGTYRVYIIDEVHMLSTGAFNALLKTLEEPPEHVKFILATTEVHKLPATILSRCQRFDFRRISPEDISARVQTVAEREELSITPDAANLIARLADGALRDALSILDQCMGHGREIDEDVVRSVVGLAGRQHLFTLSDSILRRDSATALEQINDLHNRSCDMERLCGELINHFRNLMVCKAVRDPHDLIVCSEQELQEYRETAKSCSMDDLLAILDVLGETLTDIRKGLNRRVEMEMAILRLCAGAEAPPDRGRRASRPAGPAVSAPTPESKPLSKAEPEPKPAPGPEPPAPAVESPTGIPLPDDGDLPAGPEEEDVTYAPPTESYRPSSLDDQPMAPKAPSAPAPKPTAEPATDTTVEDGPLSQETWNAIVRATTARDKPLIGAMSSARAVKKGNTLFIQPNNILLEKFLRKDAHHQAMVRAAVEQVLGTALAVRVADDEALFSAPAAELDRPARAAEPEGKEPEDPLRTFLKRADEMGIPIDIKE